MGKRSLGRLCGWGQIRWRTLAVRKKEREQRGKREIIQLGCQQSTAQYKEKRWGNAIEQAIARKEIGNGDGSSISL